MRNFITGQSQETQWAVSAMLAGELLLVWVAAGEACIASLNNGGKILLAGNDVSTANARHIAGEFFSRFALQRPNRR